MEHTAENGLRPGMHDNPAIFPTLPPRSPSLSIDAFASEDDPWRTCWEFMLTHRLTESEGAAFWTGANLAADAFRARPTPPDFLLARIAEDETNAPSPGATIHGVCAECGADPARVLAECEAKRRIVEFVDAWFAEDAANHEILRHLASIYADHPDYQEEWRP